MRTLNKGIEKKKDEAAATLFLCGDVMTGRGIDQILDHPAAPRIYEPYMKSALGYVRLAEEKNAPVPRAAGPAYIWGDALTELARVAPDLRIVNLETAITRSEEWEDKGINYRMDPANIGCLTAARIGCCCLANNHLLDWGPSGLRETLETLEAAGIRHAGAGRDLSEAEAPAFLEISGKGRVVLFSFGSSTSGIPSGWAASGERPGVNLLPDFSAETVRHITERVRGVKRQGDIVVASIHWGGNWGYEVREEQRQFAHGLIKEAGADLVHGHSSHHPKGIEVYMGKLILYGCGDFLNDYEGIGGYEYFRSDLGLMYFASVAPETGRLLSLRMTPTQMKRLRVNLASGQDAEWIKEVLNREGKRFGTRVETAGENRLELKWD